MALGCLPPALPLRRTLAFSWLFNFCVISLGPCGHRAVLKLDANTGAQAIAGWLTCWYPSDFPPPPQRTPSYINIPVTGLFDTNVSLTFVNVVIPIKNKENHSVGLNWSLLCQEFFDLQGTAAAEATIDW
ncbi:hypothetical protein PTTG_12657, partial [Puccinia triticina 1-1 BBBD Race 1]